MPELKETIARLRELIDRCDDFDGSTVTPKYILQASLDDAEECEKLRADKERLLDVLRCATTLDHMEGCLFKADRRMPCQCGFNEKRSQLERDGRSALREMDARSLQTHGRGPESTAEAKQEADPRKEKAE